MVDFRSAAAAYGDRRGAAVATVAAVSTTASAFSVDSVPTIASVATFSAFPANGSAVAIFDSDRGVAAITAVSGVAPIAASFGSLFVTVYSISAISSFAADSADSPIGILSHSEADNILPVICTGAVLAGFPGIDSIRTIGTRGTLCSDFVRRGWRLLDADPGDSETHRQNHRSKKG